MTKFQYAGPAADYPTLGFSVVSGAILDGTLSSPALTTPPDARWSVYGGGNAETGVTRYGPGSVTPIAEPQDGSLLAYSDAANAYVPSSPSGLASLLAPGLASTFAPLASPAFTGSPTVNGAPIGGGGYAPPAGGIPKTDLATAVQDSLTKADTAGLVAATQPTAARIEIITAGSVDVTSTTVTLNCVYTASRVPGVPDYTGTGTIRVRGNSTASQPKKPYKVKLDVATTLLGLPSSRDFALLANAFDPSHHNSALALSTGALTGLEWTPRYRWCEVYLNGTYQGFYQLAENVRIETGRVNGPKASGTTGAALTGKYLLEIDIREPTFSTTMQSIPILMDDPDSTVAQQKTYIQDHINAFETMLYGSSWLDSTTGYKTWLDPVAFADWYLVEEFFVNFDSDFYSSCKLTKDRDAIDGTRGLIKMGPLWDFDLSLGTVAQPHNVGITDSSLSPNSYYTRPNAKWIHRLYDDPEFRALIGTRWAALRAKILAYGGTGATVAAGVSAFVNAITVQVANRIPADQAKWGAYASDWATNSAAKKAFMQARIEFFDNNITRQFVPPAPPTNIVATTPADGLASVAFTPPSPATWPTALEYQVTASTGQTAAGASSPIQVLGLPGGTPVTFTVKTKNVYALSAASAASNQVTPTGQAAVINPLTVPGISVWLDNDNLGVANDAAVPAWPNKVSGGPAVTQSNATFRPTYKAAGPGGKPGVLFNGNGHALTGTLPAIPVGGALFAVIARTSPQPHGSAPFSVRQSFAPRWELSIDGSVFIYKSGPGSECFDFNASGPSGGWELLVATHDVSGASPKTRIFQNGVVRGPGNDSAAAIDAGLTFGVGDIPDNAGNSTGLVGYLGALIVVAQPISVANRDALTTRLKTQFGIA